MVKDINNYVGTFQRDRIFCLRQPKEEDFNIIKERFNLKLDYIQGENINLNTFEYMTEQDYEMFEVSNVYGAQFIERPKTEHYSITQARGIARMNKPADDRVELSMIESNYGNERLLGQCVEYRE